MPSWKERAAVRLAIMQAAANAEGKPAPTPYAGDPTNIARYIFGENSAVIESNRINQEITNPPATPTSPQMIWPRGLAILGR